jgi:hypothetical protein
MTCIHPAHYEMQIKLCSLLLSVSLLREAHDDTLNVVLRNQKMNDSKRAVGLTGNLERETTTTIKLVHLFPTVIVQQDFNGFLGSLTFQGHMQWESATVIHRLACHETHLMYEEVYQPPIFDRGMVQR